MTLRSLALMTVLLSLAGCDDSGTAEVAADAEETPSPASPEGPRIQKVAVLDPGHEGHVDSVAFLPGAAALTCSTGRDSRLVLWGIVEAKKVKELARVDVPWAIHALAVSPDGSWMVSNGKTGLALWRIDLAKRSISSRAHIEQAGVLGVAMGPGFLVAVSRGTLGLFRLDRGKGRVELLRRVTGEEVEGATSVAVSPDGKRILIGSERGTARIWTVDLGSATVEPGMQLTTGENVGHVAFTPDGKGAFTMETASIHSWRLGSPPTEHRLPAFAVEVEVAFAPSGRWFLTSQPKKEEVEDAVSEVLDGGQMPACVWRLGADGKAEMVETVGGFDEPTSTKKGMQAVATAVAWSPNGRWGLVGYTRSGAPKGKTRSGVAVLWRLRFE